LSFHVFNWWLDSGISSCFRHSFMLLIWIIVVRNLIWVPLVASERSEAWL
jgi:hypothetical protein